MTNAISAELGESGATMPSLRKIILANVGPDRFPTVIELHQRAKVPTIVRARCRFEEGMFEYAHRHQEDKLCHDLDWSRIYGDTDSKRVVWEYMLLTTLPEKEQFETIRARLDDIFGIDTSGCIHISGCVHVSGERLE